MTKKLVSTILSIVLLISVAGCNLFATSPDQGSPDDVGIQSPSGRLELSITSTNTFVDGFGGYYIVGELRNTGDQPVSDIQLNVAIVDSGGGSLLRDDANNIVPALTISPHLYSLVPGESTSFSYYYDTSSGSPADYDISVAGFQVSTITRPSLVVQHVQVVQDEFGTLYLCGELVNQNNQWVNIHALAGAVLDGSDNVLTADWTGTYTSMLAPASDQAGRNRTPFVIEMPVQGTDFSNWKVYYDSELVEGVTDYPIQVNLTNSYFDNFGDFHIVVTLINLYNQPLSTLAVVGLYDQNGVVLDADYNFIPLVLEPGVPVPFEFSYFGNVNFNQAEAERIYTHTVRVDPNYTTPPLRNYVVLETANDQVQITGSMMTISGTVVNTSAHNLSGATVAVMIIDSQNNPVAMNYSFVYPESGVIAPGQSVPYQVPVFLDPNGDTTGFTFDTLVQGDVAE